MNKPLVSIIIPTYNRAHLIRETLDSVLAQTYQNWECIVVDDGSIDTTSSILKMYSEKDARFHCHQRPIDRPKGANACRNYGFELSKGVFVNWFDDDDVMLEYFIEKKIMSVTSETNVVFCSGLIVDDKLIGNKSLELKINEFLFKDYVLWNFQVITNAVLFRKAFLMGKELFLEFLSRGQENEFFSRVFFELKEKEYQIVDKPLFLYRQHENTISEKNKLYVNKFKESLAYIYSANLKRALFLKEEQLSNFFYSLLIKLYFDSFKFDHKKNRGYISKRIMQLLLGYPQLFDIILFLNMMTICNFESYRAYKYLIRKKLSF